MAQPRKKATYGKPSRRPTPDFSAFSKASEYATDSTIQKSDTQRETTTKLVGDNKTTLAEKFKPIKVRSNADSRKIDSDGSAGQFVLRPPEDLHRRDISNGEAGSRKRRRLSPVDDVSSASRAFDDDNSRRYVVADSIVESGMTAFVGDKTMEEPNVATTSVRHTQDLPEDGDHLVAEVETLANPTAIASKTTGPPKTNKQQASVARKKLTSRVKEKQKALPKSSTRVILSDPNDHQVPQRLSEKPSKSDGLKNSPVRGLDEGQVIEWEEECLPSTPPRLLNAAGMTTTPKQQDLWHKLLASDSETTSLNHTDIDLRSKSRENQVRNEPIEIFKTQNDGWNTKTKSEKRSVKLVDSLLSTAQDSSTSERGCEEDYGVIGADRSGSIPSNVSTNNEVVKTQTSPTFGNQSERHQLKDQALAPVNEPANSGKGIPKVTYIRERTHLEETQLDNTLMLDQPLNTRAGIPENMSWRATGELQYESQALDITTGGPGEIEDLQGGPMRSIHELREAGGNSRIAGELDAILDDLEEHGGSSKATRRSSLLSLASKLLEASTCHMFMDQGLEPRFLAQLNFSPDIIERTLLATSLLQVVSNASSTIFHPQINQTRITTFLIGLLDQTQDLSSQVKLRDNNVSRLAQTELKSFYLAFSRLPVWRALKSPVLSGQILALHCLNFFVLQAREVSMAICDSLF